MIAGAQTVHQFYRPLEDLEEWVRKFEEQQKLIQEVKSTESKVEVVVVPASDSDSSDSGTK